MFVHQILKIAIRIAFEFDFGRMLFSSWLLYRLVGFKNILLLLFFTAAVVVVLLSSISLLVNCRLILSFIYVIERRIRYEEKKISTKKTLIL